MNSCLVLGDAEVHDLLINLTREETHTFLDQVATSLREFSVGEERTFQPEPAVVNRADGRKTLFRPFTASTGVGVKIIVDPWAALAKTANSRDNDHVDAGGAQGKPEPGLDGDHSEHKESKVEKSMMGLHGVLALCDQNGFPSGFINAEEITGYRTSLSAMILYVQRRTTANVVVFGAGKQALWHMRLALVLRGEDIESITIVNRSAERARDLIAQIRRENEERWKANVRFEHKASADTEGIEQLLAQADVVFCTTPSKKALFPARHVTSKQGGCYVSTIGSWSADMIELDPELLIDAANKSEGGGVVVVDDWNECAKSSGEIIQSGLGRDKVIEVGEIWDWLPNASNEVQQRIGKCLKDGLVVYKSVGVSLTDLAAGQALLTLARKNKRGVAVSNF